MGDNTKIHGRGKLCRSTMVTGGEMRGKDPSFSSFSFCVPTLSSTYLPVCITLYLPI